MIRFSLHNPLLVNLLAAAVLILGVLSWQAVPQELFPATDLPIINIETEYEGASPVEVEQQVTIPIEDALDSLADVDSVTSTSARGKSVVRYKLQEEADPDELMRDMRTLIDAIDNFPTDADTPQVLRQKRYWPVISIAVFGNVSMPVLFEQAKQVRQELQQLPGVSEVSIAGARDWEMWVEIDPHVLGARGVTLDEVRTALRSNLRDTPSGTIRSAEGDILLRGVSGASADAIGGIVIRRNVRGGQLLLRDLATVSLQLEEPRTIGRYNNKRSVNLTVSKSSDASTFTVRDLVRDTVAAMPLTAGVAMELFADLAVPIETRINTVLSSGVVALILLLAALYWLLNLRIALITAIGIPVALICGVITMAATGNSVNMVSMFAFLIVLGVVVDDSIIISENIYRHMENGHDPHSSAYMGAHEMLMPMLISVGTTIAAFMPIFSITGAMGAFVAVIPVIAIGALIGSLLEAFLILPSHALEALRHETKERSDRWVHILDEYEGVLGRCLERRGLVIVATLGLIAVAIAYAQTRMSYIQLPELEQDEFYVSVEGPTTAGLGESELLAARIEEIISATIAPHELESLQTNVGVLLSGRNTHKIGSQYINFSIELTPAAPEGFIEAYVTPLLTFDFKPHGSRERHWDVIINDVRTALADVPGIARLTIAKVAPGPGGEDIEVGVVGPDLDQIRARAEDIRRFMTTLKGVGDVRLDLEPGKTEYQFRLNTRGRELGLTQQQVSTAVRTGYQGDKVEYISFDDERIPVRILYPERLRHDSATFDELPITTPAGVVFLGEVADIDITQGLSAIQHRNGLRMTKVTADIDKAVTSPNNVVNLIEHEFRGSFDAAPRYKMEFLGEKRDAEQSTADVRRAMAIALVFIFFLLVSLFRTLLDPLVVMLAIPMTIIGIIFGHAVFDLPMQFLSMIGALALIGIVVNDSLILLNYARQLQERGHDRVEAVMRAARSRFRAIVLTSVTTFLGISPLIFFASGQTKLLQPMAVSLGFGLMFATVLILLAVPCLYLLVDDLRGAARLGVRRLRIATAALRDGSDANH